MTATVYGGAAARILGVAEAQGVDPALLRAHVGLPAVALERVRVSMPSLYNLWQVSEAWSATSTLVVDVAQTVQLDRLGPFGFAALTAPTLFDSLQTVIASYTSITDGGTWTMRDAGVGLELRWQGPEPTTRGIALSNESTVAHFLECTRQAAGATLAPTRVRLRHGTGIDGGARLREFLDCAVEFDADVDSFHIARSNLERPAVQANVEMHKFFRRLIFAKGELSVEEKARTEIGARLADGELSMISIARALGMTSRTLHRRLTATGTTFRRLLDEVRLDQAEQLLDTTTDSITSIALELGFSDTSAFTRAYTRWRGSPPTSRRHHRAPVC